MGLLGEVGSQAASEVGGGWSMPSGWAGQAGMEEGRPSKASTVHDKGLSGGSDM